MGEESSNPNNNNENQVERYLNLLVVVTTAIVAALVYDQTEMMLTPYLQAPFELESESSIGGETITSTIESSVSSSIFSELSHKCSNVWHSRHEKTKKNSTITISDAHTKPKYSISNDDDKKRKAPAGSGFCGLLPADLSAPHLWNEHLSWILEASSSSSSSGDDHGSDSVTSHLITSKVLQFLSPSRYLEAGHRSRPNRKAWGKLLEKIHRRRNDEEAPIIHIAAFGDVGSACSNHNGGGGADNIHCLWTVRLETLLNTILNHGLEQPKEKQQRTIVKITPMYYQTTTLFHHAHRLKSSIPLSTAIVQNNAWTDYLLQETGGRGPDVIFNAFTAQDMYKPNREWNTANDIHYYNSQRQILQEFFRTCLQHRRSTTCNKNDVNNDDPPLLVSMDDYVGDRHGLVLAEMVQGRVLQLLSDYYETAFISYAEVIQKLVYASASSSSTTTTTTDHHNPNTNQTNHHHPLSSLVHGSLKEWKITATASRSLTTASSSVEHNDDEDGLVGTIAMTLTIAYSFLRYTVDFCDGAASAPRDNAMVKEDVFELVENVVAPNLDQDLCLNNVTELWLEEKIKQETNRRRIQEEQCKVQDNNNEKGLTNQRQQCAFAFWGGTHETKQALEEYLQRYIVSSPMVGWQASHGGRLVATQSGASIRFKLRALASTSTTMKQDEEQWKIQLFSVYKDSKAIDQHHHGKLQWELLPSGGSNSQRGRRRLIPQHEHHHHHHRQNNCTTTATTDSALVPQAPQGQQQRRRALQEKVTTKSGTIEGTHDSPSTIVLPTTIPVDPSLVLDSELELQLQLVDGENFEIVSIMFCRG